MDGTPAGHPQSRPARKSAKQTLTLTGLLCFLLPIAIGLTFPIQVVSGRSSAGSVSLVVMMALVFVSLLTRRGRMPSLSRRPASVTWDWVVLAWLVLAVMNLPISGLTTGASGLGGASVVVYLVVQGALTYFYFSRIASRRDITAFCAGMVVTGAISGAFFVFESFNKLALHKISEYTLKAHEYSLASVGGDAGDPSQNRFRIDVAYRSFGLLERHSTSALWMAFGFFAYALLTRSANHRRIAFALTFVALLIAQNFSAIVTFFVVSVFFYPGIARAKSWILTAACLVPLVLLINHEAVALFLDVVSLIMRDQVRTALRGGQADYSIVSLVLGEMARYGREIASRPHQLIIGFGLGTNRFYGTSGDVGIAESLMRLGIPLWIFLNWKIFRHGITAWRLRGAKRWKPWAAEDARLYLLAAAILTSTWLMDLHYSVWTHKSIWPVMFFGMALARRFSERPKPRSEDFRTRFPPRSSEPADLRAPVSSTAKSGHA